MYFIQHMGVIIKINQISDSGKGFIRSSETNTTMEKKIAILDMR